jgi:hypothetical protein
MKNIFRTSRNSIIYMYPRLLVSISVYRYFWSTFKLLTYLNGLSKFMGDIDQQVRNNYTCVCLCFLQLLSKLHINIVSKRPPIKLLLTCTLRKRHRNFGLDNNFGFFMISYGGWDEIIFLKIRSYEFKFVRTNLNSCKRNKKSFPRNKKSFPRNKKSFPRNKIRSHEFKFVCTK